MGADLELAEAACFGAGPFLANFGCGGSGTGGCLVAAVVGGMVVVEVDWAEEVFIVVGCFWI